MQPKGEVIPLNREGMRLLKKMRDRPRVEKYLRKLGIPQDAPTVSLIRQRKSLPGQIGLFD